MKKRNLLSLFALFSLVALAQPSLSEPIALAEDLASDAQTSREQNKPIVLFITATGCPYCTKLRQEYLQFSTSDPRFILREIELDKSSAAIGFDGASSNHRALAASYNVTLTPTVIFVGPDGEKLNDAIVGIVTMDYYNYYFEKALTASTARLN